VFRNTVTAPGHEHWQAKGLKSKLVLRYFQQAGEAGKQEATAPKQPVSAHQRLEFLAFRQPRSFRPPPRLIPFTASTTQKPTEPPSLS
jgi:hypothetical protein